MRKRSGEHSFSDNIQLRKRQIEVELAKVPDAPSRERLAQQLRELDATQSLEGWLRSPGLRAPE